MTTSIIIALIAAGVPPLVGLVVYYYQAALAHLPASKQVLLIQAAHTAVQAAEQSALTNDGKKRLATSVVAGALKTWGLKVDPMYVDATIEAFVRAIKQPVTPDVETVVPSMIAPLVEQKPIVLGQQNTPATSL